MCDTFVTALALQYKRGIIKATQTEEVWIMDMENLVGMELNDDDLAEVTGGKKTETATEPTESTQGVG